MDVNYDGFIICMTQLNFLKKPRKLSLKKIGGYSKPEWFSNAEIVKR